MRTHIARNANRIVGIGRTSPTASPHPSDDEASVSDEQREEMDENLVLVLAPNASHDEEAAASEDYGRGDGGTNLGVFSAQI